MCGLQYFLAPKGTHYALHTIVAAFLKSNLGLVLNIRQIVSPYVPQALNLCNRDTTSTFFAPKSACRVENAYKKGGSGTAEELIYHFLLIWRWSSLSVFVPPLFPPLATSSSLLFIPLSLLLSGIDSYYVQMYLCRGMVRICATWSVIFKGADKLVSFLFLCTLNLSVF